MQTPPTSQPELPMDHTPAMEAEMRAHYESRWARWHNDHNFDIAMQDPTTRRLLLMTVQHLPRNTTRRKKK